MDSIQESERGHWTGTIISRYTNIHGCSKDFVLLAFVYCFIMSLLLILKKDSSGGKRKLPSDVYWFNQSGIQMVNGSHGTLAVHQFPQENKRWATFSVYKNYTPSPLHTFCCMLLYRFNSYSHLCGLIVACWINWRLCWTWIHSS